MEDNRLDDPLFVPKLIVLLIAVVAIVGSVMGIPFETINDIIKWLLSSFIGFIFSALASYLVEGVTGDALKNEKYVLKEIKITKKSVIPISLFLIVTWLVKYLLFDLLLGGVSI